MAYNKTDHQYKNNNCPKLTIMAHKLVINQSLPKATMTVTNKDKNYRRTIYCMTRSSHIQHKRNNYRSSFHNISNICNYITRSCTFLIK